MRAGRVRVANGMLNEESGSMWSIIATWPFSLQCVEKGADILNGGGHALDAAELRQKQFQFRDAGAVPS